MRLSAKSYYSPPGKQHHNAIDQLDVAATSKPNVLYRPSLKQNRYQFLVERIHALSASHKSRTKDVLWVTGTVLVVVGFGTIIAIGFIGPLAQVLPQDGRCRMGLRRYATIPLLSYDFLINILLTVVFVYLLGPVIRSNNQAIPSPSASHLALWLCSCRRTKRHPDVQVQIGNAQAAKRIENLLWRTFMGSCLVMVTTAANLLQLTILEDREWGFVCLTLCTLDITWTVSILHWLVISTDSEQKSAVVLVSGSLFHPTLVP
ncbi:hypothetical protein HBI56_115790 [Parastagonospora nodorum]|uniref:Uncharacterized protein n=2 Tax=Phaeosphaeria nodorum (strain SN15 / ATCC MYA-4574 / FGSC 10173) TaxID=321614 RepID=A0A7U2F8R8_PHANO|nr:hypothetical protein SNOG_09176 [Parastagonospora nodorum SN15]KAH3907146.1 hypothetical protein HBH56_196650 [Parastagonospora nodorum]EAT83368.1 hypothetical protein SNOG_09176 [Parastagonospora nodorum SN15]KAH3924796.1 hypothetical protein HBH54_186850 [Parastagonospora nodorum]KAH3952861.1 hypothetical protein HBH53_038980 [Parastagonospora nodorum]KAH3984319.1 hypothetical protein HBH51_029150 [Parastagonospora nodorum]